LRCGSARATIVRMSDNTTKLAVAPAPGSKTQEMRIAELEAALGKAQADASAEGWLRRQLRAFFGASWDTTLVGFGTGCVSLVPLLGDVAGAPHWLKIAGGIATAFGIAFLGRQSKSTQVTGVK
jgi:hypothetical protein